MRLGKLSDLHEEVFVVEELDVELVLVAVILELGEERVSGVHLVQDPGVGEHVSHVPDTRRLGHQLVEGVAPEQ